MNNWLNIKLKKKNITCPNISPTFLPSAVESQLNYPSASTHCLADELWKIAAPSSYLPGSFLAFLCIACNRIWSFFWDALAQMTLCRKKTVLRRLLHSAISPPPLPSCYYYYYRFHNNMSWRVTICLGDTNSKNDVYFLSVFPLPAVGCWHDWIPGKERSGEEGGGQAADPVWQWSWIPRSWAGREFAINSVCKMKQCCHFCLILELAWILFFFCLLVRSFLTAQLYQIEGICFYSAGKLQVFLLGEPVYGKIFFPGKAEIEQLNLSVSWRSATVGSWLGGTWNEK